MLLTASANWKFRTREASLRRKSIPSPGRRFGRHLSTVGHVHECGLGSADDIEVWQYAKDHDFTIVSKDSDFQERSILQGYPPKIIWVRATNCTSAEIENILRTALPLVTRFAQEAEESCLVLGLRRKTR
jgi:predicted nuclease of predicted toxin-antitoxin system